MALGHSCIDEEVAVITRNWPYLDWSTILGYIVATNKSVVITHSTDHYSRFATSRPDLYMYSPNHHCGFIVTEQGVVTEEEDHLQGVVTENKIKIRNSNPEAQLLGNIRLSNSQLMIWGAIQTAL